MTAARLEQRETQKEIIARQQREIEALQKAERAFVGKLNGVY